MPLTNYHQLPTREQDLLAAVWLEAMDWLDEGDPAAGLALLRWGLRRAEQLAGPWQPALVSVWRAAVTRYPASSRPVAAAA
jgi:hypothetical protein